MAFQIYANPKPPDSEEYKRGWNAAIDAVSDLVKSGAGMADLIEKKLLVAQAGYIFSLKKRMKPHG
jgi:hypothetical protein